MKLLEELRQEDNRANTEGLTEEELEIYDLLIAGKKLTQDEEQKVKLSAKNLYKKLVDNRSSLLVVDWYKDEQPRAKLKYEVELSLNDDLPESYDKVAFDSKVSLLMNHFVDMGSSRIWLDWHSVRMDLMFLRQLINHMRENSRYLYLLKKTKLTE